MERKRPLQIFVAYPYKLYRKGPYRGALRSLSKIYNVSFNFADEKITHLHILDKIVTFMRGSDYCIFDLSGWNPNVALELGIAYSEGLEWLICYNPHKRGSSEVPSDLRGIDRIEYKNFKELIGQLALFLEGKASKRPTSINKERATKDLKKRVLLVLSSGKGFRADQLSAALGTNVDTIQVLLDPLIRSKQVRYKGQRRGRIYFLGNHLTTADEHTKGKKK